VDSAQGVGFLLRLQESGLGVWVAESNWAYPLILTLHTVGFALLVGSSAVIDLRLLGVARGVPLVSLTPISVAKWAGLTINATSGMSLFIAAAAEKGAQPVFYVKLGFIALALLIDGRIQRLVSADATSPIGLEPRAFAALSLILWAAAIAAGRLMAYV
jgi:hypothetical protein